jgi:adenylosuccinate lyase
MESTKGVLFSQRVLLALIEKGMSRESAYGAVHRRAMESWDREEDFRTLVSSEPEVSKRLSASELDELFDYKYYVRHVDEIFERIGLE